jgi:hypothetical protein
MANSRSTGSYKEYATVNTAPGASGYFTNSINPRQIEDKKGGRDVFFSVRDSGTAANMVITIQFKHETDSDWTDYGNTAAVQRQVLEDKGAGIFWRAGVKDGDYTDGSLTFGFDW